MEVRLDARFTTSTGGLGGFRSASSESLDKRDVRRLRRFTHNHDTKIGSKVPHQTKNLHELTERRSSNGIVFDMCGLGIPAND